MHPRYRIFPFQADYSAQANVFCPHVMVIGQPGYTSPSLNLDAFGLRRQYDAGGRRIDIATAAADYPSCDLVVGNSTSFGVSLTGDDKTLSHLLQEPGFPCINLSIRGATMQQELTAYSMFRRYLPRPRRIFVVTGICDVSLATQPPDLWSGLAGGIHSLETVIKRYYRAVEHDDNPAQRLKTVFLEKAEDFFVRHPRLHKVLLNRRDRERAAQPTRHPDEAGFAAAMPDVLARIAGAVHHWGVIGRGEGAEVHVVLQPVLGWTDKGLHHDERECMAADVERIPGLALYARREVHAQVAACYAQACTAAGLPFWDANTWFSEAGMSGQRLFTDVCHLTDEGTRTLAAKLAAVAGGASARGPS